MYFRETLKKSNENNFFLQADIGILISWPKFHGIRSKTHLLFGSQSWAAFSTAGRPVLLCLPYNFGNQKVSEFYSNFDEILAMRSEYLFLLEEKSCFRLTFLMSL